ncbi:MAG: hypothetical protein AAGJ80_12735, partial [Cyanobacteria bacterium J06553_1]
GFKVEGINLSPALALESAAKAWASAAAGDKSSGPDRDEARTDPKLLKIFWPETSTENKVFQFLQDSTSSQVILPGGLIRPSATSLKKDAQARATAHRSLQANAKVDILSYICGAAEESRRDWSGPDFRSFVRSIKEALQGISSELSPRTRDDVRAAIGKRVSLREEAIPKDLNSLKPKLLSLDPLSPYLFGPPEEVSTIINSRPPPATVDLRGLNHVFGGFNKSGGHNKSGGRGKGHNFQSSGPKNGPGGGRGRGSNQNRYQNHSKTYSSKKPFQNKPGTSNSYKPGSKGPATSTSSDSHKSSNKKQ